MLDVLLEICHCLNIDRISANNILTENMLPSFCLLTNRKIQLLSIFLLPMSSRKLLCLI